MGHSLSAWRRQSERLGPFTPLASTTSSHDPGFNIRKAEVNMNVSFKSRITHACIPRGICAPCLLAALAMALAPPARAETPLAAIPSSDIGARATAGYQGDALGVTATADGARSRCGFQKLEGHATARGLWLESTAACGERLRLTATAIRRAGPSTLNSPPSPVLPTPQCYGGRATEDGSTLNPSPLHRYSVRRHCAGQLALSGS